jgi:hypothetical protein
MALTSVSKIDAGVAAAVELVVLATCERRPLVCSFLNRGLRGLLGCFFFGYALPSERGLLEIKQ